MNFDQPPYSTPFAYQGGYAYASPPPGMPPRGQTFYDGTAFGAHSIPTPAPSPRTPSSSRRRSNTMRDSVPPAAEYVSGKRPSSSRREHSEFSHDQYHTTSPRPAGNHRGPGYMHTPLHTPPPSAHAHHGTMPNVYSYGIPGFTAQGDYVSSPTFCDNGCDGRCYSYRPIFNRRRGSSKHRFAKKYPANRYDVQFPSFTPGPQSPPPRDGRQSRSHRRQSTWAGGEQSPRSPPKPSKPQRAESDLGADQNDLRRKAAEAGIPPDYSLKNWNPTERPIILLGSVFDASSLGEWIFNWTKYHHGRTHEATRTAGGLWELLIELSSKLKRARDFLGTIKTPENREIVEDFLESGERLWQKLKGLLRSCEEYMWTGARRVASPKTQEGKAKLKMGRQSGAEFVDAMFNGEKEWDKTERLMRGMATWCQRFQVNCEEILRNPDA